MKRIALAVLGLFLLTSIASAQMGGGPPPDPCEALGKFFDKDAAFSANAKVVVAGKKARDNQTMTMFFAVSGRKMRNEMDMTKMSGVPANEVGMMKQMGMDQMVILKLAAGEAYMVFPGLKSFCDMPKGKSANNSEGKLEKTELGSEVVEKHPCTKSKLTFTDKDGKTAEATVWEANDLKNFPIQYQTVESNGQTTTVTFTEIKMEKPADSLFEVPAGFQKYANMQQMIIGNMQRMMPSE